MRFSVITFLSAKIVCPEFSAFLRQRKFFHVSGNSFGHRKRNLVAEHMKKTDLVFNKPVYLGMSILDISKTLMYDFHKYIKKKYGPKAKLLMTDTDSLMYEIHTEDYFEDIREDIKEKFDTSNFEISKLLRFNKKVPGMFKDEAGGKIISEFVGLSAKSCL